MVSTDQLERNLRLYPWYAVTLESLFWAPVFILLFSGLFPIAQVLQLESIYYITVVILEVPSGYLADKMGRRRMLLIAAILLSVSYLIFFLGSSFTAFAIAKILMAAGFAFKSGTDASFFFDTHKALGREEEFGDAEAKVSSMNFRGAGAAALIGGLVGMVDLAIPFVFSSITAILAFGMMSLCVEPTSSSERSKDSFGRQLIGVIKQFANPDLRWLLGVAILSIVLVHVPYQVYQPYINLLLNEKSFSVSDHFSPLVAGVHALVVMLIGSLVAKKSMIIRRKLGLTRIFLCSTLIQNLIILPTAIFLHPIGVLLLAMRNAPKAMYMAPLSQAVNERIPTNLRATYLSCQSLSGRVAYAILLGMLSMVIGGNRVDWTSLSRISEFSFYAGMSGWVLLLLTAKFVRDKSPS